MVLWIVIAVVVVALIILGASVLSVLGRLSGLDRAMRRLLLRREQAEKLQGDVQELQQVIAGLEQRAQTAQEQVAAIKAGQGDGNGKHSLQKATTAW
jgi:biopolymer transport protein ExbB/TolQ